MKFLQKVSVLAVVAVIGAVAYEYLSSRTLDSRVGKTEQRLEETGSRVEGLARESRSHEESIRKEEEKNVSQDATLGSHAKDIAELQKRIGIAETRIAELTRSADADRKETRDELARLREEVKALSQERDELDGLRKDLKRSLDRSVELERRLIRIEKQLGIERPQP